MKQSGHLNKHPYTKPLPRGIRAVYTVAQCGLMVLVASGHAKTIAQEGCPDMRQYREPIMSTREQKFIECLGETKSVCAAGIMAGYSESYSKTHIYKKLKSDKFKTKLLDHYNQHSATMLPQIRKTESLLLLDIILADPELLTRYQAFLKNNISKGQGTPG